jgi:hypothetical protein
MNDAAKRAAEARAELQRVLAECAAALSAAGQIVSASANALEHAAANESAANANYIAYLERQITLQRQYS